MEEQIDRLIQQYWNRYPLHNQDQLRSIGDRWKAEMKNYIPSFPARTIVFIQDKDKTQILPSRHTFHKPGIDEAIAGWAKMMKMIIHEPIYRLAVLGGEYINLYEIISGVIRLIVEIPVNRHCRNEKMMTFSKTVQLLQKDQKGPLITLGPGDGIHEMDLMVLTNRNQIEQNYKLHQKKSIAEWMKQVEQCGWPEKWYTQWAQKWIEVSKQAGKWITQPFEIHQAIQQNRVNAIFGDESNLAESLKNDKYIYLVLQNNVKFFFNTMEECGSILR